MLALSVTDFETIILSMVTQFETLATQTSNEVTMTAHYSLRPAFYSGLSVNHNSLTNARLRLLSVILLRLPRLSLHRADLAETVIDGWRR